MVKGLNSFKEWFRGYEKNYAIIGGVACDLLMNEAGIEFRATKDFDMVLIVEALNADFGSRFWEYVKAAGYVHRRKSTGKPEFYRFTAPTSPEYPAMIELFSRSVEGITLPSDAVLTPLPIEDDISSLSAILLDNEYYEFLKSGVRVVDAIPILDVAYLIPFKAKAWLDLTKRKVDGGQVDRHNIKKHMSDVLRLAGLLSPTERITLPKAIENDMLLFLPEMQDQTTQYERLAAAYSLQIGTKKKSIREQLERATILANERNAQRESSPPNDDPPIERTRRR